MHPAVSVSSHCLSLPKIYCAISRMEEEMESWGQQCLCSLGGTDSCPEVLQPTLPQNLRDIQETIFVLIVTWTSSMHANATGGRILISQLLTAWNSTLGLGISSFLELHFCLWSKSFCYLQSASLPHSCPCWTLKLCCSLVMETLPHIFPTFLTISESMI